MSLLLPFQGKYNQTIESNRTPVGHFVLCKLGDVEVKIELANIQTLVNQCQERQIQFIYTIAPGLDIQYSDESELQTLKEKIDQVLDIGVKHLCLLFDDIPFQLSEADQLKFSSFAQAQAFVANALFEHFQQQGYFLFCPTDYCARMTKPDVRSSSYLKELGEKLHKEIAVFWTGPEIVSETIPGESICELQVLLKRKPIIWDNLHANDYDIRRVYFGPYTGRASTLKKEVRGILTNPNNEYAANFIPLRTFASYVNDDSYEAQSAYLNALEEWLPHFESYGEPITLAELELLGDLFYLFFEHGKQARDMLNKVQELFDREAENWDRNFAEFQELSQTLTNLFHKLTELKNRDLLYSLYAYAWEIEHAIRYLLNYFDWLKQGNKAEAFGRPGQLANTFRGGLAADIERLFPLDKKGHVKV